MSWFISAMICIIMEGSTAHSNMYSLINQLNILTTIKVGGLITLPGLNLGFFAGFMRILLWDYSFYYGGYEWIRFFWLAVLSPGAAWGVIQTFIYVYASFIRPF
jgi:hypothetical protein